MTKIKKQNVFNEDPQKLFSFLDAIEYPVVSNEFLNDYLPIDLDKNDLNEIIQEQEVSEPEQIDADNLDNIDLTLTMPTLANFLIDGTKYETDKPKEKIIKKVVKKSRKKKKPKDLIDKNIQFFINICVGKIVKLPEESQNPFLASLKSKIEVLISDFISDSFCINLLDRLKAFESACIIFDVFKFNLNDYFSIFELSHDVKIAEELINFNSTFDKDIKLDKNTCKNFSLGFNAQVWTKFYIRKVYDSLHRLPNDVRKIIFYYELMKLYKYVDDIPEIIILGGLYEDKLFKKLTCHIHLINLFIEKNGNIKDNRVFILFLIVKTIETFYSPKFKLFLHPSYEIPCAKDPHDFYFFFWEPSSFRYHLFKKRKRKNKHKMLQEKRYFKTLFMIYLYQYMIFIEYSDLKEEFSHTFQLFIGKVLKSRGCVGCLFNEFLKIIKTINKKSC